MLQHVRVVVNRGEDKSVIVRVFVLFRILAVCFILPIDEESFHPSVSNSTLTVTLSAFYPAVLMVSHEVSVHHQHLLPGTLGGIIFVQPLRVTVSFSLSQSERLPRCWHGLLALAFTVFTRFYNPSESLGLQVMYIRFGIASAPRSKPPRKLNARSENCVASSINIQWVHLMILLAVVLVF